MYNMKNIEFAYDKLKGKIKEIFSTQIAFSNEMDMNDATLTNKLNNKTAFTQREIFRSCELLNIELKDIPDYFFKLKVRKNELK